MREVEVERHECADRQRVVHDHPCADEQHRRLREQRHDGDQRDVQRSLTVRTQRLLEDELGAGAELLLLRRLLGERLHDVHADDVLLGDRRDVRETLLDVAQRRVRDVAVAVRQRDEQRRGGEHDDRELPLEEEEDDRHGDDGEDVLEEEDEAVAEEEAHALEVDRGAAHQLPGLVAVVEAEREAHEVGVEPAAHVHLDVERLPAGEDPAAEHARSTHDAEPDDRATSTRRAWVSRWTSALSITPRPVTQISAIPRRLRADGEDDRDDQPATVRAQEPEQPEERRAIGNCAHPSQSTEGLMPRRDA